MGLYAGLGRSTEHAEVQTLTKKITFGNTGGAVVPLGWLPKNAAVIGSGVSVRTAWAGSTDATVDIGFDNSEQGATTDADAFTETALALHTAVGHLAGDVVLAANLFFSAPARAIATVTGTGTITAGEAYVYVTYIDFSVSEEL